MYSQYRLYGQLSGPEKSDHISGVTIYAEQNYTILLWQDYIHLSEYSAHKQIITLLRTF